MSHSPGLIAIVRFSFTTYYLLIHHSISSNIACGDPACSHRGGSRRSFLGGGLEGEQPRPPAQELQQAAVTHPGLLGQTLADVRLVQANPTVHRPTHVDQAPPGVPNQRAPLDPHRERSP